MSEPFADSVAALSLDLLPKVRGGKGDIILFGHSLGAIVAFELALALQAVGGEDAVGLIVSGCSAPDTWTHVGEGTQFSDDVLLSLVSAGGGGNELFGDDELRELFLPMLRADMEIVSRYGPKPDEPGHFPILALCGEEDAIAPPRAMEGWRNLTTDFAGVRVIEGEHFFLAEHHRKVGNAIGELLARVRRRHCSDA